MLKSVVPLFQSPLIVFDLTEMAALNEQLIAEFEERRKQSSGVRRSNKGGWHSEADLFKRTEPATKKLGALILQCIRQAEQKFAGQDALAGMALEAEGWANLNPQHAFNAPHNHAGFAWSGCYYVNMPAAASDRGGAIEFLDPRTGMNAWPMTKGLLSQTKVHVRPSPGTLLIFPSYLMHWVYPNESPEERVTVAFNARFVPAANND